jgi:hypothetical protein
MVYFISLIILSSTSESRTHNYTDALTVYVGHRVRGRGIQNVPEPRTVNVRPFDSCVFAILNASLQL